MQFQYAGHAVFAGDGRQSFDAHRPCVVFIHGAGLDHTVWLVFERYFARHGFNVLALDLPGHGRSGGDPLPSIETLAEWLGGVLDNIGVKQALLVGHSMGALIAFECAAQIPERRGAARIFHAARHVPGRRTRITGHSRTVNNNYRRPEQGAV